MARTKKSKPIVADTEEQAVTQVAKKKRDWVPNPQKNFGEEHVEPGDNARYLRYAMASLDLPPIDISDPAQVEKRIKEYLDHCVKNDRKPNMVGMANWLGVERETVRTWKNGDYRGTTHSVLIRKAVGIMEELWVDYMMNGKVNPASGIFIGKNHYQYKDTQDVTIRPDNPLGEEPDQKAIEARLAEIIIDED
jgi:hypothetical protein